MYCALACMCIHAVIMFSCMMQCLSQCAKLVGQIAILIVLLHNTVQFMRIECVLTVTIMLQCCSK